MDTHLRIKQNVDCRGRHLAAGQVVARAELTRKQLDDLLENGFAAPCPAPADPTPPAAPVLEQAATPPIARRPPPAAAGECKPIVYCPPPPET